MKTKTKTVYRVEPHHPEDPDGQGEVDHQNDNEEQDKQVEAALPPPVDAYLVDVVRPRPGRAAARGCGDILLPHHLLPGNTNQYMRDTTLYKKELLHAA